MRKTKLFVAIISSALCLASCQIKPEYVKKTGFEESRDYLAENIKKTLDHKNTTVVYYDCKYHTRWTERILGDTSYLVEEEYAENSDGLKYYTTVSKTWSFINGKRERIVAKEETPWSEGARYIVQHYVRDDTEYKNNYKSYLKFFDLGLKLDEWLKPYTSKVNGKSLLENMEVLSTRINLSVINGEDHDSFSFNASNNADPKNVSDAVSIRCNIDSKTDLVDYTMVISDLPDGCGPFGGQYIWYELEMSYDDVEKIDIPDISGWDEDQNA